MKPAARKLVTMFFSTLVAGSVLPAPAGEPYAAADSSSGRSIENIIVYGARQGMIALDGSTGTKLDVPLVESPLSMTVITAELMDELGVQTVQDTLMYSAGVYGGAYGTDSRGDWALVRGAEPVQYVDGLKSLFGYYNNTRPDVHALARVEILKGPASVLYGQGTTGGVLNLMSKLPEAGRASSFSARYGSFDRIEASADLTGAVDAGGSLLYRLVGVYRDAEMQVDHVSDDTVAIAPSLTWLPTERTRLSLLVNYQDSESGTSTQFLPWQGTIFPAPNGPIGTDTFISEPGWDRYDTKQLAVTTLLDHEFNDTFSIHLGARHTDSSADYDTMYADFPPTVVGGRLLSRSVYVSRADAEAWVLDARLQAKFTTGPVVHNVAAGFDYQDAMTDNDYYFGYSAGGLLDLYDPVYGNIPAATPITLFPATLSDQKGVYLQDHMKIADRWIVSAGVRYDEAQTETEGLDDGQKDDRFTGRVGLMYLFDSGISPYVSYTQSFNPVIGADLFGNPFEPVAGEQWEAGIKYQPDAFPALFTAAVYDLAEQNRLTSDPANPFNSIQSGEVGVQGIELEAQAAWRDFNVLASYSYTDARVTQSNDGNDGFHVEVVPDHLFSTWVSYRPGGAWQGFRIGAGVRHAGNTWDGADAIETPAFTLFDAMVGYDFRDFSISVDADNLADNEHLTSCLARGDCFQGARRTVAVNVEYRF